VPPYTYSWNFGDGSATGSGTTPSHIFSSTGSLTVIATVTDSRGESAQASTSVPIGNVTSTWNVVYTAFGDNKYSDTVIITQSQTQVTGTARNNSCSGPASGSISNPRSLTVNASVSCSEGGPVAISYQGVVSDELLTWKGHVTGGGGGCTGTACPFSATRSSGATGLRSR
jgi:hypothetical protein